MLGEAVRDLRGRTRGEVMEPGDGGYEAARAAYNAMAERAGYPLQTETGFGRQLRRLRPDLRDAYRTVAGRQQHVWLDLGLRTAG